MPVEVSWMYQNRVIKIRQYGKVSSQQLVDAIAQSQMMIRQGIAPVHTVVAASSVEGKPEIALGDLRKLIPTVVEGSGWIMAVQSGAMDRFMTSLGMQIAGAKYRFVPDEESALKLLLEYDPTLIDVIR